MKKIILMLVLTFTFSSVMAQMTWMSAYKVDPLKMKDAKSEDFWVLVWHCGVDGQCKGDAVNGTGRFEGVTGKMSWWNDSGWGEGSGTFIMK